MATNSARYPTKMAGAVKPGDAVMSRNGFRKVVQIKSPAGKGMDTIELVFSRTASDYVNVYDQVEVFERVSDR